MLIGFPLFTWISAIDAKMRPGFTIHERLFVLTHTKPWKRKYVEISSSLIVSNYLKPKKSLLYIVEAYAKNRYSNTDSGYLTGSSECLMQLASKFKITMEEIIVSSNKFSTSMIKFSNFQKDYLQDNSEFLHKQDGSEYTMAEIVRLGERAAEVQPLFTPILDDLRQQVIAAYPEPNKPFVQADLDELIASLMVAGGSSEYKTMFEDEYGVTLEKENESEKPEEEATEDGASAMDSPSLPVSDTEIEDVTAAVTTVPAASITVNRLSPLQKSALETNTKLAQIAAAAIEAIQGNTAALLEEPAAEEVID